MIFSSKTKLFFCIKVSIFVKKLVSFIFLFSDYTLIRTTGLSWISALRIMYLPLGSNNLECILQPTPLLKRTASPRGSEVPEALIISAPLSCVQDFSCSILECVFYKKIKSAFHFQHQVKMALLFLKLLKPLTFTDNSLTDSLIRIVHIAQTADEIHPIPDFSMISE